MNIKVTPAFKKSIKRLNRGDKEVLDDQVRGIVEDPDKGSPKKGDLSGVFTVGFKMHGGQYRIAYMYDDSAVKLLYFGPRENFYRDMKGG